MTSFDETRITGVDNESNNTKLEKRIAALEADRDRFIKALQGAAEMCLKNPMVRSMIPKDMKERLEEVAKNVS